MFKKFARQYDKYTKIKTFEKTAKSFKKAKTLIPEAYTCSEFYKTEKKKIFQNTWTPVAFTNQFKSQEGTTALSFPVAGTSLIITKKGNEYFAFRNTCIHRGCKLIKEEKPSKKSVMVCPYHRWTYNLQGELMGTPGFPRDRKKKLESKKLFSVPLKKFKNILFANFNNTEEKWTPEKMFSTVEWKDYPLEDLVIVKQKKFKVKSNWKLPVENLMEYYHLPSVHPTLNATSKKSNHDVKLNNGYYLGCQTNPLEKDKSPIDPSLMPPMVENLEKPNAGFWHALFPNSFYFVLGNHLFACIVEPTGVNTCTEHCFLMVHPNQEKEVKLVDDIWDYWVKTNVEDIEICESVQLGIESGGSDYVGGPFVDHYEDSLYRYQRMVIEKMTGTDLNTFNANPEVDNLD